VTIGRSWEEEDLTELLRVPVEVADSFRAELLRVIALPDRSSVDGHYSQVCDGTSIFVHLSEHGKEDEVISFEEPLRAEHTREWGLMDALLAMVESQELSAPVHSEACEFLKNHFRDARKPSR
jgi:hypothetical protein